MRHTPTPSDFSGVPASRREMWNGSSQSTGGSGRAAALESGRVDATFVSAPAYFKLEERGYRNLGNISDYEDLHAPFVFLFKKAYVTAHPRFAELLIKADAEAIKRLYEDTQFAVQSYLHYNRDDPADIERILDLYRNLNIFQRAPYILRRGAVYVGPSYRWAHRRDHENIRFYDGAGQQHRRQARPRRIL